MRMKTKNLLPILLLAVSMVSCTTYYQVKTQVLLGSAPGVEIVEYAKESGTEMIIMTRSSRGPLRKLGSVATYIVRNASFLDVIVMREEGDE